MLTGNFRMNKGDLMFYAPRIDTMSCLRLQPEVAEKISGFSRTA